MRKISFAILAGLVFLCAACTAAGPVAPSTPDPLPGSIYGILEVNDYLEVNSAQPATSGGVVGWAVKIQSKQDPMENMGFVCFIFQKAPTTVVGDFAIADCLSEGQSEGFMPMGYYVAYLVKDLTSAEAKAAELNVEYKRATPEESR